MNVIWSSNTKRMLSNKFCIKSFLARPHFIYTRSFKCHVKPLVCTLRLFGTTSGASVSGTSTQKLLNDDPRGVISNVIVGGSKDDKNTLLGIGVSGFIGLLTVLVLQNQGEIEKKINEENTALQNKIHEESIALQNKIHEDNNKFKEDREAYNRAKSKAYALYELRKELRNMLHGKAHREVSDGIAQILSKYDQKELRPTDWKEEDKNKDKDKLSKTQRDKIAEVWYSRYKEYSKENNSIKEKRENSEYQVNMCRSLARDNFISIYGLLEEYASIKAKGAKDIDFEKYGLSMVNIISVGQAKELLDRYYRFVRYVKPVDDIMGYTKNDGIIYRHERFKDAIKRCMDSDANKKRIEDKYKDLEFEKLNH